MPETIDKLAKHRRSPVTAAPVAPDKDKSEKIPKKQYEPYRLSKDTKRFLDIRAKVPAAAECVLNGMLLRIEGEWRLGLWIILTFGTNAGNTMVVNIKGKKLQELFQAIKDSKIDWLEEYDSRFHLPVTDENAPFIKSIEIVKQRPEPPPPLSQRH